MKNALAFRSAFSAFLRSRLGAAGVEFALLLPMAAFVLAVALESARLSIAYALIERAVEEGIHEAKLNRGAEAETLVKAALEKWRFGVFDPSDLFYDRFACRRESWSRNRRRLCAFEG